FFVGAQAIQAQQSRSGASPRGTRPVPSWLIAGAFPVGSDSGAARLTRNYLAGDEGALVPAAGDPAGNRAWRSVTTDSLGRVDLNTALPDQVRDNAAAYAMAYIFSPADRSVRIVAESDDDDVVW